MLTIQNYNKLKGKPIGDNGWYVGSVSDMLLYDPMTFKTRAEQYQIRITNNTKNEAITLRRMEAGGMGIGKYYKLQGANNILFVDKNDIMDIDKFCNCLLKVSNP